MESIPIPTGFWVVVGLVWFTLSVAAVVVGLMIWDRWFRRR
jgi:hypothetical protein